MIPYGGEYRWQRHKKRVVDENHPLREGMHGHIQHGVDYTPLFRFLLSKVGQPWKEVHREAVSRLDKEAVIYYMVAIHPQDEEKCVRCGDTSYYSGLRVDDNGLLQKVDPLFSAEDVPMRHDDCTYTFNGKRVPANVRD